MMVRQLSMLPFSFKKCGQYLALLLILTVFACEKENVDSQDSKAERTFKVAVVLPYSDGLRNEWQNTIDWAMGSLNDALATDKGMKITTEWYDEDVCDIRELFGNLATDEDVYAIIGPLENIGWATLLYGILHIGKRIN